MYPQYMYTYLSNVQYPLALGGASQHFYHQPISSERLSTSALATGHTHIQTDTNTGRQTDTHTHTHAHTHTQSDQSLKYKCTPCANQHILLSQPWNYILDFTEWMVTFGWIRSGQHIKTCVTRLTPLPWVMGRYTLPSAINLST